LRLNYVKENEAAAGWLGSRLAAGDVVLVKGSRVAGMESIVEGLIAGDRG